jgi:hypothetical protein
MVLARMAKMKGEIYVSAFRILLQLALRIEAVMGGNVTNCTFQGTIDRWHFKRIGTFISQNRDS